MKRRSRVLRAVMRTAGVVLGLSVAAWTISLFRVEWAAPRSVALFNGELIVYDNSIVAESHWYIAGYDAEFSKPRWRWSQIGTQYGGGRSLYVRLPLWMPTACSGLALGGLLVIDRRPRALACVHRCPTCNYDLTGIDGVCPECGGER